MWLLLLPSRFHIIVRTRGQPSAASQLESVDSVLRSIFFFRRFLEKKLTSYLTLHCYQGVPCQHLKRLGYTVMHYARYIVTRYFMLIGQELQTDSALS